MGFTAYLNFQDGGGWQDITGSIREDIPRDRIWHNQFRAASDKCEITLGGDVALSNQLLAHEGGEILVDVRLDGTPYFYGVLQNDYDSAVSLGRLQRVTLNAVDTLYRLGNSVRYPFGPDASETSDDFAWTDWPVSDPATPGASIVHQLLYMAGWRSAEVSLPAVAATVPVFRHSSSDRRKYGELLNQLLEEAGYVLVQAPDGVVTLEDVYPVNDAASKTLRMSTPGELIEDYITKKRRRKFEAFQVSYRETERVNGAVVFDEVEGRADALSCNIDTSADPYNGAYPAGASATNRVYSVYQSDNPNLEIAAVENASLDYQTGAGALTLERADFSNPTKADVYLSGSAQLTRYRIIGDAIYYGRTFYLYKMVPTVSSTDREQSIEFQYLSTKAAAERLLSGRVAYWQSSVDYEFSTTTAVSPGEVISLVDDVVTGQTVKLLVNNVAESGEWTADGQRITRYDVTGYPISAFSLLAADRMYGDRISPSGSPDSTARVGEFLQDRPTYSNLESGTKSDGSTLTTKGRVEADTGYIGDLSIAGVLEVATAGSITSPNAYTLDKDGLVLDAGGSIIAGDATLDATGISGTGYSLTSAGLSITGGSINLGSGAFTVDDLGNLAATAGTVGGWNIGADLYDAADTIRLRPDDARVEIRDGAGNVTIALGYLGGVASYAATDYGLYINNPPVAVIDGGFDFENGDYRIADNAAYVIRDSGGAERGRFGSLGSGVVGLRVGDPGAGQGIQVDENGSAEFSGTVTIAGGSGIAALSDAGALAGMDAVGISNLDATVTVDGLIRADVIDVDNLVVRNLSAAYGDFGSLVGSPPQFAGGTASPKTFASGTSGNTVFNWLTSTIALNINQWYIAEGTYRGKQVTGVQAYNDPTSEVWIRTTNPLEVDKIEDTGSISADLTFYEIVYQTQIRGSLIPAVGPVADLGAENYRFRTLWAENGRFALDLYASFFRPNVMFENPTTEFPYHYIFAAPDGQQLVQIHDTGKVSARDGFDARNGGITLGGQTISSWSDVGGGEGEGPQGAWLSGCTSFNSDFRNNFARGGVWGSVAQPTAGNDGIEILQDGMYRITAAQRSTADGYSAIAESGNRNTLEDRTDGVWWHDHAGGSNDFAIGGYVGPLYAGEVITFGPSSSTAAGEMTYSSNGYSGYLIVEAFQGALPGPKGDKGEPGTVTADTVNGNFEVTQNLTVGGSLVVGGATLTVV